MFSLNHSTVFFNPSSMLCFGSHFKISFDLEIFACQNVGSFRRLGILPHFGLTLFPINSIILFATYSTQCCCPYPILNICPLVFNILIVFIYASITSSIKMKSLTDVGKETFGSSSNKQDLITEGTKRVGSS